MKAYAIPILNTETINKIIMSLKTLFKTILEQIYRHLWQNKSWDNLGPFQFHSFHHKPRFLFTAQSLTAMTPVRERAHWVSLRNKAQESWKVETYMRTMRKWNAHLSSVSSYYSAKKFSNSMYVVLIL